MEIVLYPQTRWCVALYHQQAQSSLLRPAQHLDNLVVGIYGNASQTVNLHHNPAPLPFPARQLISAGGLSVPEAGGCRVASRPGRGFRSTSTQRRHPTILFARPYSRYA
jgi:hypothetical protein